MKISFELKELPELNVACLRNIGPYNTIGEAFGKLFGWAGPRGLVGQPDMKILAIYHDDPNSTEPDKLRSDACLTVPPGTETGDGVSTMAVPGGLFAVGHAEIAMTEFGEAWNRLMDWMSENRLQMDDRLCYELYLNDHEKHPQKLFIIDVCQPVKPL